MTTCFVPVVPIIVPISEPHIIVIEENTDATELPMLLSIAVAIGVFATIIVFLCLKYAITLNASIKFVNCL